MKRNLAASLAFFLVAAWAGGAHARTFVLGAVTLSAGDSARLHVLNAEGGTVDVELVFADASSNPLLTASATLASGAVKVLDIRRSDVPGTAGVVVASVIASHSTSPSTCSPVVTLQVSGPKDKNGSLFATARPGVKGLASQEIAAIQALRTLAKAQSLFFDAGRLQGQPGYASKLTELVVAGLLPPQFGVPDYDLLIATGLYTFKASAAPHRTGDRSFFADESGVVRFEVNECNEAVPSDEPIRG